MKWFRLAALVLALVFVANVAEAGRQVTVQRVRQRGFVSRALVVQQPVLLRQQFVAQPFVTQQVVVPSYQFAAPVHFGVPVMQFSSPVFGSSVLQFRSSCR